MRVLERGAAVVGPVEVVGLHGLVRLLLHLEQHVLELQLLMVHLEQVLPAATSGIVKTPSWFGIATCSFPFSATMACPTSSDAPAKRGESTMVPSTPANHSPTLGPAAAWAAASSAE